MISGYVHADPCASQQILERGAGEESFPPACFHQVLEGWELLASFKKLWATFAELWTTVNELLPTSNELWGYFKLCSPASYFFPASHQVDRSPSLNRPAPIKPQGYVGQSFQICGVNRATIHFVLGTFTMVWGKGFRFRYLNAYGKV